MIISFLIRGLLAAILAGATITAFAEEAPVYDVDSYPPQFDAQPSEASASNYATPPRAVATPSGDQLPPDAMPPAAPAMSQQQPMQQSLSLDQRVARVEQQVNNSLPNSAKVDDLQSQIQALRGQVEELNHQLSLMQTQQKSMYSDLDKRVSQKGVSTSVVPSPSSDEASAETDSTTPAGAIKTIKAKPKTGKPAVAKAAEPATTTTTASTTTTTTAVTAPSEQPNSAEEQQIYQTAYSQIKAKKYNEAAATLQNMLHKYPSGQFAANAHYWLGELYGLMGKNDQALAEFNNVVKNYPESPKIADAQLKLGLLYAAEFKWPDAKSSLKKVISNYPGTSSARLASEQLKQIKQTGH